MVRLVAIATSAVHAGRQGTPPPDPTASPAGPPAEWGQVGQDRCSAKVGTGWIRSVFCKRCGQIGQDRCSAKVGTGWIRSVFCKGADRLDEVGVLRRCGQVGRGRCSAKVGPGWTRSLFCEGGDSLDKIGVLQRWGQVGQGRCSAKVGTCWTRSLFCGKGGAGTDTLNGVLKCDVMNVASFALILPFSPVRESTGR